MQCALDRTFDYIRNHGVYIFLIVCYVCVLPAACIIVSNLKFCISILSENCPYFMS